MILFLEDWKRYPSAIADTKTTNKSFLRLAQLYKSMGVQNYLFPLALIQPELQGVDPHSKTLTTEQKVMIGLECRYNIWYYLREVVRIPPVAGPDPVAYIANRGNIAVTWLFMNNIDSGLIQPRQTGKSVSTDCLSDWVIYIGASNTRMIMLTKDDTLRKANVERLKSIRDLLPPYLVSMTSQDADNQFELTCNSLKNRYTTGVAQNSESSANNLGRGLTSPILHCDEGPFMNFIGVTLPAALASGNAARDEAKRHGRPHGNIFTTTAGKKDDRDGKYMYDMFQGAAPWMEIFLDAKNKHDLLELVRRNRSGKKDMVNCTFSHRQLGYSDEWLYQKIAETGASGEQADRDFLNIWTSGSQRSPLSVKLNEIISKSEKDVLHSEISADRYVLRWYIPEEEIAERMASGHFIIGMDTSDAVGRDSIALVMTDVRDLSVVAAGCYNETNLIRFAFYVVDLLIRYQNTTLVIERKSTAQTIIDALLIKLSAAGIDPFKRIFNKIVDESRENEDSFKEIQRRPESRSEAFYDLRKASFGFVTTKETRTILYTTVLQNAAKKAGHLVHDKSLTSEILGLVEKNGRIDHVNSGNDDMVISWLLTHWFLAHGRNLHYYGIDTNSIMTEVSEMGRTITPQEAYQRRIQEERLQQVDQLLYDLQDVDDEFLIAKIEHQLRHLASSLNVSSIDQSISIDAMIQQAGEDRRKRRRIDSRADGSRRDNVMAIDPYYHRQHQQKSMYETQQRKLGSNRTQVIEWC